MNQDDPPLSPPPSLYALTRGRVDPAFAALTRTVGRGLALVLPDGAGTLHMALAPAEHPPAPGADALALEGAQGPLVLDAGVPFLRALTGIGE